MNKSLGAYFYLAHPVDSSNFSLAGRGHGDVIRLRNSINQWRHEGGFHAKGIPLWNSVTPVNYVARRH